MSNLSESEIMSQWMGDISTPLVSIICITYNQEAYISETLNGFLAQDTKVPFEIIIGEDCSTDNTLTVIKSYQEKYPNLIKVYTGPCNIGPAENFIRTMAAAKGKYIALCEGDDYWIYKHKLQRQVDMFDQDDDLGMICSNLLTYSQDKKIFKWKKPYAKINPILPIFSYKNLIYANSIASCTVMFERELLKKYIDVDEMKKFIHCDYFMWLEFVNRKKINFLEQETAVYRVSVQSASHSENAQRRYEIFESRVRLQDHYLHKYPVDQDTTKRIRVENQRHLFKLAYLSANLSAIETIYKKIQMYNENSRADDMIYKFRKSGILRTIINFLNVSKRKMKYHL